jgi:fatty acid desaturase
VERHSGVGPTRTTSRLFAYSRYDAIPVVAELAHFGFVLFLFLAFPHLRWWALVPLGLVYAISISWNINGISHNFLHNPYFRSPALNRAFSVLESLTLGFSQVFYEQVHKEHHMGNADLPDEHGHTVDPLSIYKHGHDREPENPWTYVFCSYFRDDPRAIFNAVRRRSPALAAWGVAEIASFVAFFGAMFVARWRFMLFFLPSYYFGHCLSYLNGYYLHYGGNPDVPLAWGVSSYHRLYNWLWFNNGYHAEHHYRPRVHWTRMKALHEQLEAEQRAAGTRVISPPHALGFMEPL